MEKNKLALEYGVKEAVAERKEAYAPTFYKSIAAGVAIVLAGVLLLVIPAIVYQEEKMVEIGEVYALGAMLTLVAVATFFFVKSLDSLALITFTNFIYSLLFKYKIFICCWIKFCCCSNISHITNIA